MSKKIDDFLNEKMQVKLPGNLSKENILANIENSKAEVVELPKKRNLAKKLVPIVASLLLVVGLVGTYFSLGLGDKNVPPVNNGNENVAVIQNESYDKIYSKFDTLHKEAKKDNIYNGFSDIFYSDDEEAIEDGAVNSGSAAAGDTAPESAVGSVNSSIAGNVSVDATADDIASANKDYGTTNTQEKDVDEGDIIKTDGNYLYIANADNKSVSIVDVTGKKMIETSQIDIKDNEFVKEIYINTDKLVVVGTVQDNNASTKYGRYVVGDCIAFVDGATFVKTYNISDRKAPKLIDEYSQEGSYNNSRMIGTKLYAISTYYVDVYNDDYRDNCIPEITTNGTCQKIPAGCISVIEESEAPTYAVITTLDLSKNDDPESTAILGDCGNIYASSKGLFLCENIYEKSGETTKIYRFEYTDTGVEFKCAGIVDGYLNNQFSMSYDGEYFRVATTANKTGIEGDMVSMSVANRVNNLYILNNDMQIVGKVEDMAKGELIKSVRFVGNMAYVVTFRQTDPLFVIDLSNPENPTVKGELKIPGFSEYLHPITENLLVGVGRDGTMTGTNGDCKVSLFDVSNPYEPKESSILKVSGGAYCHTPVSHNHKAYIPLSENEFAVPFSIDYYVNNGGIESSGDYYIRYNLTENRLCEIARYRIGDSKSSVMGATYVENTFYVVFNNYYANETCVKAFDLTTNKEIDAISTASWRNN